MVQGTDRYLNFIVFIWKTISTEDRCRGDIEEFGRRKSHAKDKLFKLHSIQILQRLNCKEKTCSYVVSVTVGFMYFAMNLKVAVNGLRLKGADYQKCYVVSRKWLQPRQSSSSSTCTKNRI